jgi:hypothetical protein
MMSATVMMACDTDIIVPEGYEVSSPKRPKIDSSEEEKKAESIAHFLPAAYQLATCDIVSTLPSIFDAKKYIYRGRSALTPLGERTSVMKSLLQKSIRKCDSPKDAPKYELAMIAIAEMTYGVRLLKDKQDEARAISEQALVEYTAGIEPIDVNPNPVAMRPEHEQRQHQKAIERLEEFDSRLSLAVPRFTKLKQEMTSIKSMFTNGLNRLATIAVEDCAASPALVIAVIDELFHWNYASNALHQYELDRAHFNNLMAMTYRLAGCEKFRPSVLSHLYADGNEAQLKQMRPNSEPLDVYAQLTRKRAAELIDAQDERMFAYVMNSTPWNKRLLANEIAIAYPSLHYVSRFYTLRVKSNAADAHAFLAFLVFCAVYVDRLNLTWEEEFVADANVPFTKLVTDLWNGNYKLKPLPKDSIVLDKHVSGGKKNADEETRFFRTHSWCSNASPLLPEYAALQALYLESKAEADSCKKVAKK